MKEKYTEKMDGDRSVIYRMLKCEWKDEMGVLFLYPSIAEDIV